MAGPQPDPAAAGAPTRSPAGHGDGTAPGTRPVLAPVLEAAIAAAREAGARLRAEFHRPGGPRGQGTHADIDIEIEHLLAARLRGPYPWTWLGEETGAITRPDSPYAWVIDPHDGTGAFLDGRRGSSVSIALLRDGEPVLGVVHAYAWPGDDGDIIWWAEGCGPVHRNGLPVQADFTARRLTATDAVAVSHFAADVPLANALALRPARFLALPSLAWRLALAAVGDVAAAVALAGPRSWDYAGGHALLRGAGGVLVDASGRPVTYDRHGRGTVAACFGGPRAVCAGLVGRDWRPVLAARESLLRPRAVGISAARAGVVDRAQGCLLGQIVGDSLGALVEFMTPHEIARRAPGGVRDLADGGVWETLAGQPTDDSEMALSLARTLVRDRRWDRDRVLAAYAGWYESGPFDIGDTTARALGAAAAAPPDVRRRATRAAVNPDSQANGSLMRVSPIGILAAGDPERAARLAGEDSRLTHPHPVCVAACAAYAAAIAVGVAGGSRDAMRAAALHHAGTGETDTEATATVRHCLQEAVSGPPADFMTHQGWVLIAFSEAFHRLASGASVEEAIIATVGSGGDTDTNGAITGALLGAADGRSALPWRWVLPVLTCRPMAGSSARRPRPDPLWPDDALALAEALLSVADNSGK